MAKIVIVDDDMSMNVLVESLHFRGHETIRIASATEALDQIDQILLSDIVILDVIMTYLDNGTKNSYRAGMEVLREIRKHTKKLPIIAYTATQDAIVIDAIKDDSNTFFLSKWGSPKLKDLINIINKQLGIENVSILPKTFIVHGQNDKLKLELKNFLQNTLKLPEPIILHEQPNCGRTLLEKFEDYADQTTLVFVLITPDDIAAKITDTDDIKRRGRQNVIFEMGYFLGKLGRKSGRVILLYLPPLELPSDLSGIGYIDISKGIEAVGEQIRLEVQNVKSCS